MIASTLRLVALGCAIALAAPADAADYDLYGDSLWWRLVPPGGGAASEIVGTIHVVDPAVEPTVERALDRLDAIGGLVVEIDMDAAAAKLEASDESYSEELLAGMKQYTVDVEASLAQEIQRLDSDQLSAGR